MDDMTPVQWAVVLAVGAAVVLLPKLLKRRPPQQPGTPVAYGVARRAGPQPQQPSLGAAVLGLLKGTFIFLGYCVVTTIVYQAVAPSVSDEVHGFVWLFTLFLDALVLGICMRVSLPDAVWQQHQARQSAGAGNSPAENLIAVPLGLFLVAVIGGHILMLMQAKP